MPISETSRHVLRAAAALAAVVAVSCSDAGDEETISGPVGPVAAVVSAYDILKVGTSTITIDGNLSDWAGVPAVTFADDPGNGRGSANNSASVKMVWNDTYLYAAYDVTDSELLAVQTVRDHADLYKDDAIELYIDPRGTGAVIPT
jgi:hypothetical protein